MTGCITRLPSFIKLALGYKITDDQSRVKPVVITYQHTYAYGLHKRIETFIIDESEDILHKTSDATSVVEDWVLITEEYEDCAEFLKILIKAFPDRVTVCSLHKEGGCWSYKETPIRDFVNLLTKFVL
jgi:hypothetical protein